MGQSGTRSSLDEPSGVCQPSDGWSAFSKLTCLIFCPQSKQSVVRPRNPRTNGPIVSFATPAYAASKLVIAMSPFLPF
jgi:hypothetical protein